MASTRRLVGIASSVTRDPPQHTHQLPLIEVTKLAAVAEVGDEEVGTLRVGNVVASLMHPAHPELVPALFGLLGGEPLLIAQHLRWILQKDLNRQDMFLIGPPGPLKRRLAMLYCELRQREVEYLCLSRDTTESDLKQRREIVAGGSTSYTDQAPVRAAINGRVLILDGLERAERNVLPTLNNLLENREMTLEDGRLMIAADRYDELLEQYSVDELEKRRLVRVSPDFRVIALGLPVPLYPGRTLDPPLRSRFQARSVPAADTACLTADVLDLYGEIDVSYLQHLMGMVQSVRQLERKDGSLSSNMPHFSDPSVLRMIRLLATFPEFTLGAAMGCAYPYSVLTRTTQAENGQTNLVERAVLDSNLSSLEDDGLGYTLTNVVLGSTGVAEVSLQSSSGAHATVSVPCGPVKTNWREAFDELLPEQRETVTAMLLGHATRTDMCVLGGPGSGKTTIVRAFAAILGYVVSTVHFFQDMTSRDILQRRSTDIDGATLWENTTIIRAAVLGELAILDGTHRTPTDVMSNLDRLCHDRDIELFDGSRLMRWDRYDSIRQATGFSDEMMTDRQMFRIHESFRIVAVGEPPSAKQAQWITSETMACFSFHVVPEVDGERLAAVLRGLYPNQQDKSMKSLVEFSEQLRRASNDSTSSLANQRALSLRQLRRICSRTTEAAQDVGHQIARAVLLRFIPRTIAQDVETLMELCGVPLPPATADFFSMDVPEIVSTNSTLTIGDTMIDVPPAQFPELIPKTLFYENALHCHILREMLRDMEVFDERAILLMGNQGVGKNKLADKLLMLMQREREYLQLHRDTTVQSLTTAPSLEGGVVQWNDSPLVRAVRNGYVLVVDEADKAPVEVVTILKSLIEDGEMVLSDGKKIVPPGSPLAELDEKHLLVANPDVIEMHPRFRMIVLANRPGYPFLGNDFFREIGDVLSCHIIDNPDRDSELQLLRSYGPDVPEAILVKLADAFEELRKSNEEGLLAYPYSTRELVAIVKHLQAWPKDGLVYTLDNVLSFDRFDSSLMESLRGIFHRYAIPVGVGEGQAVEHITEPDRLDMPFEAERWVLAQIGDPCDAKTLQLQHVPFQLRSDFGPLNNEVTGRITSFSEEVRRFQAPMDGYGTKASGLAVLPNNSIHVLANASPTPSICSFPAGEKVCVTTSLQPEDGYRGFGGFGTDTGSTPDICALPRRGALCAHLPKSGKVVLVDPALPGDSLLLVSIPGLCPADSARGLSARDREGIAAQRMFSMVQSLVLQAMDMLLFFKRGHQELILIKLGGVHQRTAGSVVSCIATAMGEDHIGDVSVLSPDLLLISAAGNSTVPQGSAVGYVIGMASGNPQFVRISRETEAVFLTEQVPISAAFPTGAGDAMVYSTPGTQLVFTSENPLTEDGLLSSTMVWAVPTPDPTWEEQQDEMGNKMGHHGETTAACFLPYSGLYVRAQDAIGPDEDGAHQPVRLQVVDLQNTSFRSIEVLDVVRGNNESVSSADGETLDTEKLMRRASGRKLFSPSYMRDAPAPPTVIKMAELSDGTTVLLHEDGTVRIWELDYTSLTASLAEWRRMLGMEETDSSDGGKIAISVLDEDGNPLGEGEYEEQGDGDGDGEGEGEGSGSGKGEGEGEGKGKGGGAGEGEGGSGGLRGGQEIGSARGSKAERVAQVEDEITREISEEAQKAAAEMAEQALAKRLEEIDMNEAEFDAYDAVLDSVAKEIVQLRLVLDAAESRQQEREWQKFQLDGELDDARLVDGVAGERHVYRKRGIKQPDIGAPQRLPKRVRFVFDLSGSMYRFNGEDGRLDRSLEAVTMFMEALHGFEHKILYSIVGHSGDSECIELVQYGKPPSNKKERFKVLQTMFAHAQYCSSGDETLNGARNAIEEVGSAEADEHLTVIISDANLRRYGIEVEEVAKVLTGEHTRVLAENADGDASRRVRAVMIFIASIGDEAEMIIEGIPQGHGFVCLDMSRLPQTMREIFTQNNMVS